MRYQLNEDIISYLLFLFFIYFRIFCLLEGIFDCFTIQGGHRNNSVSYAASQSVGASTSSISLAAPKAPSANVPVKQDVIISYNLADQYPPEQESATKKHIKLSDQKTLKVRLKVGSDNLSTRKNDIYSGLGLDGTPSSSLDDSSDSEGISHEPQDAPFESPTSILQVNYLPAIFRCLSYLNILCIN